MPVAIYSAPMPTRLKRYYNAKHLHFLTCSCYHRHPWLNTARRRDLFLKILEQARVRYRFTVVGYVLMPEHIHLLISEPELGDPSLVMKVVKQRFARRVRKRRAGITQEVLWPEKDDPHVWQKRFYDFNVWSERKRIEKLRYMHRNPVKRALVAEPDQWRWSSFRSYAYGEKGLVRVNFQEWALQIKRIPRQRFGEVPMSLQTPLIR
jgi:putative transposase